MKPFEEVAKEVEERGDAISPLLPGANWIGLDGNFTPAELRAIADEVESQFKEGKTNGNPN